MNMRGSSGFTVLEMLVALCILGLLAVYAMQSFQHMRRMDTVLDRIEQRSTLSAVEQHLRNLVSAARPAIKSKGAATTVNFEGTESQLRLVVASDGGLERGGLLSVQIEAKSRGDGFFDLMTRRTAYPSVTERTSGEELVLLERIKSFELRYFGNGEGEQPARWHSQWRNRSALPRLVEVMIQRAEKKGSTMQRLILQPAAAGP